MDVHSKWPEIVEMASITTQRTIAELMGDVCFIWITISDNGSQFISDDFADFMKVNGIKHIRCVAYHPASDGACSRMVGTNLQESNKTATDTNQALTSFLLMYHTTPYSTTNEAPSKLFLGQKFIQDWTYC